MCITYLFNSFPFKLKTIPSATDLPRFHLVFIPDKVNSRQTFTEVNSVEYDYAVCSVQSSWLKICGVYFYFSY